MCALVVEGDLHHLEALLRAARDAAIQGIGQEAAFTFTNCE